MFQDQGGKLDPAKALLKEAVVHLQPSGIETDALSSSEVDTLIGETIVNLRSQDIPDTIGTWPNSGSGGSAFNLTAPAGRPTLSDINGHRAILFTGAEYMQPATAQTITRPHSSLIVVERSETSTDTRSVFGGTTGTGRCLLRSYQNTWEYNNAGSDSSNSTDPIVIVTRTTAGHVNSILATTMSSGGTSFPNEWDWCTVADNFGVAGEFGFRGRVSDFLVWDRDLTDIEMRSVQARYIRDRGLSQSAQAENVTAWRNSGTGGSAYDLDTSNGVSLGQFQGKQAAYFDNTFTQDILRATGTPVPEPFTLLSHLKADSFSAGSSSRACANSGGATTVYMGAGAANWQAFWGGANIVSSVSRHTDPVVLTVTADNAGGHIFYVDNSQFSNAGVSSAWNWAKLGNSNSAIGWNGYSFEHVLWDRVLDENEVGIIVGYMTP